MPYLLDDLVINRVDLVDEGSCSAAFIELYKRKERSVMDVNEILSKMKPEHSEVIRTAIDGSAEDLRKAKEDLATVTEERDEALRKCSKAEDDLTAANEDLEKAKLELETLKAATPCECDGEANEDGVCKSCGRRKKGAAFDETETMKSMPQAARELFEKMRTQKEAAEEELRKAKEAERTAEAVAKANVLKSIPVEQEKLINIIKSASPEVLEILTIANAAIEGTVLNEVGKNHTSGTDSNAWNQIEAKASEIAKRDSISKEKAITVAISENPELYREYLKGGTN